MDLVKELEGNIHASGEPAGELSSLQKAYFMGQRSDFDYHAHPHLYLEFDFKALDVAALERAFTQLVKRHQMLRATISDQLTIMIQPFSSLPDLIPFAFNSDRFIIPQHRLIDLPEAQVTDKLNATRERIYREINKEYIPPNMEIEVSWFNAQDGTLTARVHLNIDLLFFDGYSVRTLLHELSEMYNSPDCLLSEMNFDFEGFNKHRLEQQQSKRYQRAKNYWLKRLDEMPDAPVLPERLKSSDQGPVRSRLIRRKHLVNAAQWQKFCDFADQYELSPGNVLFTAYNLVVAAWSKYRRFTVTMMLQNRTTDFADMTGVASNLASTILVATDFTQPESFADQVRKIQSQVFVDMAHSQICGLEILQEKNRISGSTFQAASPVTFVNMLRDASDPVPPGHLQLESSYTHFSGLETPQVILDHQAISQQDGGVALVWDTMDSALEDGICEAMFNAYIQLVEDLCERKSIYRESYIDLRTAQEIKQQREYNHVPAELPECCLHEYLYQSAPERLDKTLVSDPHRSLSYGEVLSLSNRIAWTLRERLGVKPNELVAIYATKSWQQVVAAQAIIASGGAYVPIDPHLPDSRKADILARCECRIVLTLDEFISDEVLQPYQVFLVSDESQWSENTANLPRIQTVNDLAYVIFTSGSTGNPKGVVLNNLGPANTVEDINRRYQVTEEDVFFGISELNFDLSVYDIFGVMAAGASLVLPPVNSNLDPQTCLSLVETYQVTVWNSVPALAQLLSECILATNYQKQLPIRLFMMSGDWIPVHLPEQLRAQSGAHIASLGGATEGSVWSIYFDVEYTDPDWSSIPYGYPLDNQTIYVLDECQQPRPTNVPGELYIGGDGVALGYWGDLQKTERQFIDCQVPLLVNDLADHNQDSDESSSRSLRLYRTGDWGVRRPEGFVDFLGRDDSQVKVRGYRIELGEIESSIQQHSEVSGCVAKVEGTGRDAYIVAFIKTDLETAQQTQIKDYAESLLPHYMLPKKWAFMKNFPLGGTGKVNRKALRIDDFNETDVEGEIASTPTEIKLAKLWSEVIGLSSLPVKNDSFFDLGGSSFVAVQLVFKIQQAFGVTLRVTDILAKPQLMGLAALIDQKQAQQSQAGDSQTDSNVVLLNNLNLDEAKANIPSERAKTFWFHPSGGNILCYDALAKMSAGKFDLYGIHSPDYEHYQFDTFEQLVSFYVSEIKTVQQQGPYHLAGWSMGGVIAFAAAQQLLKDGEQVASLVLIDSPAPLLKPHPNALELAVWFISDLAETTYLLELSSAQHIDADIEAVFEEALSKQLIPEMDITNLKALYRQFVKNLELLHGYQTDLDDMPDFDSEMPCLFVKASMNDPDRIEGDSVALWQRFLPVSTKYLELNGNHHTMLKSSALESIFEVLNSMYSSSNTRPSFLERVK